jgi:hypothetical protein
MGFAKNWHNQSAVEVVVSHFARRFGNQCTPMTGGTSQPPSFDALARAMVGADRVVGAEGPEPQRMREMVLQMPRFLN